MIRAAWHTAAAARSASRGRHASAAATDGELHAARAAYERKLAWAPAWVGPQLRATALAARETKGQAVIARHQADLSPASPAPAARAAELEQRAAALEPPPGDPAARRRLPRPLAHGYRPRPRGRRRVSDRRAPAPPPRTRAVPLPRPPPPRRPRTGRAAPRNTGPQATPAGLAAASFPRHRGPAPARPPPARPARTAPQAHPSRRGRRGPSQGR